MGCTVHGHKTFLIVCSIGLVITGLAVLILGMKMKNALTSLSLDSIPVLLQAVKAVIASGFFIAATGGSGFCGACYEVLWLIYIHLGGLGTIIAMEFALGITLVMAKNTIEHFMGTPECGNLCNLTLQTVVLDLAMPTAGVMMTIIIMQAFMIYSAMQLFYYLRDKPKDGPVGPTVIIQNLQMQNVESQPPSPAYPPPSPAYPSPQPMYAPPNIAQGPPYPPHPGYVSLHQTSYDPVHQEPYAVSPNRYQEVPHSDPYANPPPYAEVGIEATVQFPETNAQQTTSSQTVSQVSQSVPTVQLPDASKYC